HKTLRRWRRQGRADWGSRIGTRRAAPIRIGGSSSSIPPISSSSKKACGNPGMRFYHAWHFVFGVLALTIAFAISALTVNRLVRRKLKLSLLLLGAYGVGALVVGLELAPDAAVDEQLISIERLAFAAGLINLAVISFLNPLREDRVPD